MGKTIKELRDEIDKLQSFIDACDEAARHNIGLDEATCDRYANAVEVQRQLSSQLLKRENCFGGLVTRAKFRYKDNEIEPERCVIDDVVELSSGKFDYFSDHLLEDCDFISERTSLLGSDEEGRCHCILVLGNGSEDGILVNSEGYDYARCTAFMPYARRYVNDQTQAIADEIIRMGAAETESGKYVVSREELADYFKVKFDRGGFISNAVEDKLRAHKGLSELTVTDDRIEMIFGMDHVPEEFVGVNNLITLWTLMGTPLENVHVLHCSEEHDHEVIESLDRNTLTDEGKAAWSEVLNARVTKI